MGEYRWSSTSRCSHQQNRKINSFHNRSRYYVPNVHCYNNFIEFPGKSSMQLFGDSSVFIFNLGPGVVPWFLSSEYMPIEFSAGTQAIGSVTSWFSCFIVGLTFPPLQDLIGQYVFVFFAATCGFFGIFVKIYGVESKGKSVEQVQMIFKMKAGSLPK